MDAPIRYTVSSIHKNLSCARSNCSTSIEGRADNGRLFADVIAICDNISAFDVSVTKRKWYDKYDLYKVKALKAGFLSKDKLSQYHQ